MIQDDHRGQFRLSSLLLTGTGIAAEKTARCNYRRIVEKHVNRWSRFTMIKLKDFGSCGLRQQVECTRRVLCDCLAKARPRHQTPKLHPRHCLKLYSRAALLGLSC
jgi:hypothetical protein